MNKKKSYQNIRLFLIVSAISVIALLFYSKNSPFYPMNDWEDINCFFTVGRSVLNGKILYREIYEQKGPLLYFFFALVSIISPNSFVGVFVFEVISFALFLFYSVKIVLLFDRSEKEAVLSAIILAVIVTVSHAFSHGGSVEELTLFALSASMYLVLKHVRKNEHIKSVDALIVGALTSYVFWMKYTICGFFAGLCIFVFFYYLKNSEIKGKLISVICSYIIGFLLLSFPILLYFLAQGALFDLFIAYFYNNLFLYNITYNSVYGDFGSASVVSSILIFIKNLYLTLAENSVYSVLIILGLLFILTRRNTNEIVLVAATFTLLSLLIYGGGRAYSYYGLSLSVFSLFGLIALFNMFDRFFQNQKRIEQCELLLVLFFVVIGPFVSRNTYLLGRKKEEMPQYIFADRMHQFSQNPTMMNYGFLDGGFYFAAEIEPVNKYFCGLNLDLDEIKVDQDNLIEKGMVDFIVSTEELNELENYIVVAIEEFPFYSTLKTYYLYQIVD